MKVKTELTKIINSAVEFEIFESFLDKTNAITNKKANINKTLEYLNSPENIPQNIISDFGLNQNIEVEIPKLKDNLNKILDCTNELEKDYYLEFMQNLYHKIKEKYPNTEMVGNIEDANIKTKYLFFGFDVTHDNKELSCCIGTDSITSKPYYGLSTRGFETEK